VPVEEIETTETVEKTKSERVLVCDSCGLDSSSSGSDVYRFTNTNIKRNLYFCEDCFVENGNASSIKNIEGIIPNIREDKKENAIVAVTLNLTVFILGFAWNGIAGIIAGAILVVILALAVGIFYEIFIE